MTDTVTLGFPRDARFYPVARLVVGGLAAPMEMGYDALDDLQLAISSLLDNTSLAVEGDVELRLAVDGDQLHASIGPFGGGSASRALDAGSGDDESPLGLRGVLDRIVDAVEVRSEGDAEYVALSKRAQAAPA